ncbi:MAG: hypothetical protein WBK78_05030 [Syntrophomonadaceae bacterium]|jgi:hypothetical protein
MTNREPIYSARARKTIELLKFKSREEVAKEFDYKNWKSLDTYMRRKNFVYDSRQGQYIPAENRFNRDKQAFRNAAPNKVLKIIKAFDVENPDPKDIAEREGFADHREMAEFMKAKGYEWNVYKNNYVKITGFVEEPEPLETVNRGEGERGAEAIGEFMPFIRFLYDRREKVYQLLDGVREDGKIPRYAIPGLAKTKAIYMSDKVADVMGEFSREKNVTQREIVETALVEYLQKYGFKQEIEALLQNRLW